jgi:hypothetical protein
VFRSFLILWGIASYIISLCYFLKRRSAIRYRRALLYALIYPPSILIACFFAFKIGEIRWRYGDSLLPFSLSYTGYTGLLLLWLYLYDGSFFLLSPYAHILDIIKGTSQGKFVELVSKWTLPTAPNEGYLVRIVQFFTLVYPLFVMGIFFSTFFAEGINNLFLR